MSGIIGKLYRLSPEGVVRVARALLSPPKREPIAPVTAEFLRSPEYEDLMRTDLPYDGSYDLHEAQNVTANFRFRHFTAGHRMGVFRWRGIQKNRELVLELVAAPGAVVVDFGGAVGPLGLGSLVVDQLERDASGKAIPYRSLSDVGRPVDVVFSSHCLEHIADLRSTLAEIRDMLRPGGVLIAHVPSWTCARWRAGTHKNPTHIDHAWTFGLSTVAVPPSLALERYLAIDTVLAEFFAVEKAECCGDDSLFLVARKDGRGH